MNPILIIFIILIAILILFLKLNNILLVNKDNALRTLAGVDAQLIKRSDLLAYLLPLAQESMKKEDYLIKDIYAFRAEVLKLKNRVNNATKRFELQEVIDEKLNYLLIAMSKYPELKSNFQMTEALKDLAKIEDNLNKSIKLYNDAILALKWSVESFPSNIIAKISDTTCNYPYYKRTFEEPT